MPIFSAKPFAAELIYGIRDGSLQARLYSLMKQGGHTVFMVFADRINMYGGFMTIPLGRSGIASEQIGYSHYMWAVQKALDCKAF